MKEILIYRKFMKISHELAELFLEISRISLKLAAESKTLKSIKKVKH